VSFYTQAQETTKRDASVHEPLDAQLSEASLENFWRFHLKKKRCSQPDLEWQCQ